ncbi:hypothetical protein ACHAWC_000685 [Mediolabrus comicus]
MTDELGFNTHDNPLTCKIWNDPKATTDAIHGSLTAYTKELDKYNELIKKFEPVSSIMNKIKQGDEEEQSKICDSLRLHPNGMKGIFPSLQFPSVLLDMWSLSFLQCDFTKSAKKMEENPTSCLSTILYMTLNSCVGN